MELTGTIINLSVRIFRIFRIFRLSLFFEFLPTDLQFFWRNFLFSKIMPHSLLSSNKYSRVGAYWSNVWNAMYRRIVLACVKCTIITSAKEVMFLPVFVCLSVCLFVCVQDNSKSYVRIFLKFWGYVGHGISYKWLNFGGDPAGILDSGLLWSFRYHCVKGSISEPLAKRRWWPRLANSFALAEVPALFECFL